MTPDPYIEANVRTAEFLARINQMDMDNNMRLYRAHISGMVAVCLELGLDYAEISAQQKHSFYKRLTELKERLDRLDAGVIEFHKKTRGKYASDRCNQRSGKSISASWNVA